MEHCACDNAGTFCLVVSDKGTVYFGGVNKKGEAGEAGNFISLSSILRVSVKRSATPALHIMAERGAP